MTFLWPGLLWLMLLIPALVALYLWSQRRRKKYALRFSSLGIVKESLGKGPGFKRHVPPILFLAALALIAFGLSRPSAVVPLMTNAGVIILAMDASGSMRGTDVQPSRFEAAQTAAKAFIKKQPGGTRLGLVSFAASASVAQPPTDDRDAMLAAVDRLTMQRGTAIGSGLLASINAIREYFQDKPIPLPGGFGVGGAGTDLETAPAFGQPSEPLEAPDARRYESAIIILMSDGQSNVGPDAVEVAQQARVQGIRVYTVGLGSADGVVLNFFGRSMRVYLDEETLKAIADKTNAAYHRATSDTDLRGVYERLGTDLVLKPERVELTALFSALAAILLLVAAGLSMMWFNRLV